MTKTTLLVGEGIPLLVIFAVASMSIELSMILALSLSTVGGIIAAYGYYASRVEQTQRIGEGWVLSSWLYGSFLGTFGAWIPIPAGVPLMGLAVLLKWRLR